MFALSNPQGGAVLGPLATFTLTITDDDAGGQIQFALASATVDEDNPAAVNAPPHAHRKRTWPPGSRWTWP